MKLLQTLFLLVTIFTTVLNANSDLKKVSVQLHWKHQFEFAGFYAAKEKGFYKEAGLDVDIKEFRFEVDVIDDVVKGKSTFGTNYPTIILKRSNGSQISVLSAFLQSSPHILVSLESSNIKSIKDFRDKKIMINKDGAQSASFVSMLKSNGVSLEDMQRVDHTFDIDDLINNKVDIMAVFRSNELYKLDQMSIKYKIWDPKDYGFDFYDDVLFCSDEFIKNNKDIVTKFKNATIKGWVYAFENIEKTADIILEKYNSQNKTKDALVYEGNVLKKLAYYDANEIGSLDKNKIQRIFDIYNLLGLTKDNIVLDDFIFGKQKIDLTKKEREYLKSNRIVKMCNNPNWKPIEFKENGKVSGIAIDVMKLIERDLNIKIEHIPTDSWKQSQEFLKERKCDILPAAIKTEKRMKYANFTQPYLQYKLAIITTKDKPFVNNIQELVSADKTIARKQASGLVYELKSKYPNVKIVETVDYLESLQKVSKGEVYCTIATLPVVSYYMSHFALNNLQIAGYTDMEYKLSIAVRDDKLELLNILDKALQFLDQKETEAIHGSWTKVKIEQKSDYKIFIYILIFIVALIILMFLRQGFLNNQNKRLKELVQERTKELQDEKNRFQLAIEGSNEGIFDWNVVTGEVYFSPRWKEQIGYKDDELKNDFKEWESRVHPEDLSNVMDKVNSYFKGQSDIFETVHRIKHKKGHWVYIEARAKALVNEEGKVLRLVGSHNDVTELVEYRKTLENKVKIEVEKNRKNELQLMEQSKMVALGNMIGNIAHQWRQPLSLITTSATAIQIKKEMNDLSDDYLEISLENIINNAQYLSDTIDTFRNFVKEGKSFKEVILQERLDKALYIVEATLKSHHIKLINKVDYSNPIKLNLVIGELAQVIINIVNNAKDVLVEKKIDEPWIKLELEKYDDKVILTIEDNGGGVPVKIMPYIFDPYFTTKHQSQGTGLGLHMSYKIIVESLKGNLYVKNTQSGAKFYIELPLQSHV